MAMDWSYPRDGTISSCQDSLNMDTRGWRRTMLGELKEVGMVWSAAVKRAQDRNEWKNLVEALCATWRIR